VSGFLLVHSVNRSPQPSTLRGMVKRVPTQWQWCSAAWKGRK